MRRALVRRRRVVLQFPLERLRNKNLVLVRDQDCGSTPAFGQLQGLGSSKNKRRFGQEFGIRRGARKNGGGSARGRRRASPRIDDVMVALAVHNEEPLVIAAGRK